MCRRPLNFAASHILLLAAAVASLSGCGSKASSDATAEPTNPSAGDAQVPWCAVYQVLNASCQQCHLKPPVNGAPLSLTTFAETQAPFGNGQYKVYQIMQRVVSDGEMPWQGPAPDGGAIIPPVRALSAEERATLLTWVEQGATNFGGEDCPMTYDWAAGRVPNH